MVHASGGSTHTRRQSMEALERLHATNILGAANNAALGPISTRNPRIDGYIEYSYF